MAASNLTVIHRIVERCRSGEYPACVARLPSGWLVLGERQAFRGQCLLLPDPVVSHLNALSGEVRARFLADMALSGDALLACTQALRINYALFGNVEPALHAHIIPRQATEPDAQLRAHPWSVDWALAPVYSNGEHGELRQRIAAWLAAPASVSG